jgi:hypothetical protein
MACPACFSQVAEGSPLVDAALLGVMALLAVTIGVLAAFAMFIRHLMKLSANQEETS